jgi:DNA integrity scanning protein DisA with diadenylate cyclase activity
MINASIVLIIILLLFLKFFFAALVTSILVLLSICFQYKFFKNKIADISKKFYKYSVDNSERTMFCIDNIKEIKIMSMEDYFYDNYNIMQKNYTDMVAENNFYGLAPMYVIEILVVLSLFILAGIISMQNINNSSGMMASYAVIAAAIFRIAPALSRIQNSINGMNSSRDFVKTLILEYEKSDLNFMEEKIDLKIDLQRKLQAVKGL